MSSGRTHEETGGLRFGKSYWRGVRASRPFAKLSADAAGMELRVRFPIIGRRFTFERSDITGLKLRRGGGWGLQVEHSRADYPPYIVFFTTDRGRLAAALTSLGYELADQAR